MTDAYTSTILRRRISSWRQSDKEVVELNKQGLKIRRQNTPEDISENIVKEIIRRKEGDKTCVWAKSVGKAGDLFSEKCQPEVKALSSKGPLSFSPDQKFSVLYVLEISGEKVFLWKVNVTANSPEWKNLKVSKKETMEQQCIAKRRPRLTWKEIKTQLSTRVTNVYSGSFESILTMLASTD